MCRCLHLRTPCRAPLFQAALPARASRPISHLTCVSAAQVFAFADAVPGALFLGYMAFWRRAPWALTVWVPLISTISVLGILLVEVRLALGYFAGI